MKKRTNFLILIITVLLSVLITYKMTYNSEKTISNLWTSLVQSKNSADEKRILLLIKSWLTEKEGYFKIRLTKKNGKIISSNGNNFDFHEIESISIEFYWKDNKFIGKNWKPIDNDNYWVLFRE